MEAGALEASAEVALAAALKAGASAADVMVAASERLVAGVRLGKTEKIKHSRERRIGIRVFVGHRSAGGSSADAAAEAVSALAAETVTHARLAEADPFAGLPDPSLLAVNSPDLLLHDPKAESFSPAEASALAAAAEEAALGHDTRITNSEGAEFEAEFTRLLYATTDGFRGSYPSSRFMLSVIPVAFADGQMQRDWWYTTARRFPDLEPAAGVGTRAAMRTVRRLGARQMSTRKVPVVFEPEVAASLLGHLGAAASGTALTRRASFLLDKLGKRIAAADVTILDDGRRQAGLASRPFDSEGLPTRENVVVGQGTLGAFLLDSYCARKLGRQPTGSAFRSLASTPAPRASNLYLLPGQHDPREIIGSIKEGLLVTELIGMGVNLVTGDYSRGATGQWIENGEIAFPVEQVTIAGNLLEMMGAVDAVGSDLTFNRATCSPTLKIASMTVAGV